MNPPEAIEIIKLAKKEYQHPAYPHYLKAFDLGIEALKREMLFRERVPKKEWSLLPGETKD